MSASKKHSKDPKSNGTAAPAVPEFRKPLGWEETDGFSKGFVTKAGLAQMLQRGVIMDVINVEQALIAQEAGAVAVMALERVPADIRQVGSCLFISIAM
jgi:hypothetical protein